MGIEAEVMRRFEGLDNDTVAVENRVKALEDYAQVHRQQISEIVETLEHLAKEIGTLKGTTGAHEQQLIILANAALALKKRK